MDLASPDDKVDRVSGIHIWIESDLMEKSGRSGRATLRNEGAPDEVSGAGNSGQQASSSVAFGGGSWEASGDS